MVDQGVHRPYTDEASPFAFPAMLDMNALIVEMQDLADNEIDVEKPASKPQMIDIAPNLLAKIWI